MHCDSSALGDVDYLSHFLTLGANIEYTHNQPETLLIIAAIRGHSKAVKFLVEAGANIDSSGTDENEGMTALMYAIDNAELDTTEILLQLKANVNAQDDRDYDAFNYALNPRREHPKILEMLLRYGIRPNIADATHCEAFLHAIGCISNQNLKLLLRCGINLNIEDVKGNTPLLTKINHDPRYSAAKSVKLLLQSGVNVNAKENSNNSAVMLAITNLTKAQTNHRMTKEELREDYMKIIRLLLDYNADVNIPDSNSITPLMKAFFRRFDRNCEMAFR